MPTELEWFWNIPNPRTWKAYRIDSEEFSRFLGVEQPKEIRKVRRHHVIAWRKLLESRGASAATIRRKLATVASLFNCLCERNAMLDIPVHGVARPPVENANEGKTPAIGDGHPMGRTEIVDPSAMTSDTTSVGNATPVRFWCPMHPEVQSDVPAKCDKCGGMDLMKMRAEG